MRRRAGWFLVLFTATNENETKVNRTTKTYRNYHETNSLLPTCQELPPDKPKAGVLGSTRTAARVTPHAGDGTEAAGIRDDSLGNELRKCGDSVHTFPCAESWECRFSPTHSVQKQGENPENESPTRKLPTMFAHSPPIDAHDDSDDTVVPKATIEKRVED